MRHNFWPEGKDFAFTIIDDTDNSTLEDIRPIYDFLAKKKLRTTKTVWVYPPRDSFKGQCLLDKDYQNYIHELHILGFEIALHNIGSGCFYRSEILAGLEKFKDIIGEYPNIHINHADNPDNIYWGIDRYVNPLKLLLKLIYGEKRKYYGNDPQSHHFWGDFVKTNIRYIRNHCFSHIDVLKNDPKMPYRNALKDESSNFWFSSADGHSYTEFIDLLKRENVDKLEKKNGCCIVYTHFASNFLNTNGTIKEEFKNVIEYVSSKNGWFSPANDILDYLYEQKRDPNAFVGYPYLFTLDIKWLIDRVIKKIRFNK